MNHMLKAYKMADRQATAETDDPHMLVSVLFDELIRRVEGFLALQNGSTADLEKRNEHFGKALSILHALQSSLDFERGKDISDNLFRIYEYARQQLLVCLRSGKTDGLHTALDSLKEISSAWKAMKA